MIHYALNCGNQHEFTGWFNSSASFDRQAETGLLECPVCGDTRILRALMTPALARPRAAPATVSPVQVATVPPQAKPGAGLNAAPGLNAAQVPAQVLAALQRLRAEVEKHCDYVGSEFPEVARSIHRGETEQRGIYGEATPEEAEMLADDGIQVTPIPWVPRAEG